MYMYLVFVLKQNETELTICSFLFQNGTDSIFLQNLLPLSHANGKVVDFYTVDLFLFILLFLST